MEGVHDAPNILVIETIQTSIIIIQSIHIKHNSWCVSVYQNDRLSYFNSG